MRNRGILYILLALGIVLIGSGVWLMLGSTQAKVVIPEGNPVIYERVAYLMKGENSELYIYGDGSILYIEEKGLRPPGGHPTRTWSTGNFTVEQINNLLDYFENSGLNKLDDSYGGPVVGGSDMSFTIIVNSDNLSKKVTAFGYPSPDKGATYPDMPSPLNEIYGRLRTIAMSTEKVYQENISP
ncbi:MAG: hypothetical protein PHU23_06130 [Dehalococcoidales bacterium]|nr:hypothetical protein [Dehalococcoidales bacterium]